MYPITQEVQEIFENNRQVVDITFDSVAGNLHLTEANVLSGGLSLNRYCVSGDNIEIGSVVAGELQLTINNSDGSFNDVTFEGSEMFVRIGSKDWETEEAEMQYIPLGYFTVDEAPRKLESISFSALDRMIKFDKAVNLSLISFPITVQGLLTHICSQCGVTLAESITGLPNYNYSITAAPTGENLTYRQLLSWIAQITGTCAFIDWNGQLVLKWYTDTSLSIPPSLRYSSDLKENAITISGVRVVNEDTEYISGTDTYAISIEGNELIQHHYSTVASALASSLSGFTYTPFEATVKSMPFLYPLDKVLFVKGEDSIPTIITNTTYVLNGSTTLEGRGETSKKKTYAEMNPLTSSQNVAINNGLTRVSATLTQEFTAADGAVMSSIANAENKYDESEFTAGTITLRGFKGPVATGYAASEHNGEYYLNQTNGWVYLSDGSAWTKVATLTLMTTVLNTRITQTDSQIRSDVATTLQSYSTTTQMNSAIDQKANSILLASSQLTYGQRTKNLIPFVLSSASKSSSAGGTTCTRTSSGTGYRLTSNPTSNITFSLYTTDGSNAFDNPKLPSNMMLPVGRYIVSGIGFTSDIQYRIQYSTDGSTGTQAAYYSGGNEITFDIPSTATYVRHYIWIRSGTDLGSGVTVRPMIRDAAITDSTYSAGVDAGAYMCSSINLTPEKLELDAGKLIINSGNFQLDENGVLTSTAGTFKTSNYTPATSSVKTVGGQVDLGATGSDLIIDTANFKVSGDGAVNAEDANFKNCTIEGGSFEVDSTEQSGQVTNRITLSNSYLGDSESVNISAEQIELSRSNTGASGSIWLDNANALSGSAIHISSQHGPTYDKAVYSADSIKFDVDTAPNTANISYVDSNDTEQVGLSLGRQGIVLGNNNTRLDLSTSMLTLGNLGGLFISPTLVSAGRSNSILALYGSRIDMRSSSVTINDRPVATSDEVEARLKATVGHSAINLFEPKYRQGTSANTATATAVCSLTVIPTEYGKTHIFRKYNSNFSIRIYGTNDEGKAAILSGGVLSQSLRLYEGNYIYDENWTHTNETQGVTCYVVMVKKPNFPLADPVTYQNITPSDVPSNLVMVTDSSISDDTFEPYVTPTDEKKQDKLVVCYQELESQATGQAVISSENNRYQQFIVTCLLGSSSATMFNVDADFIGKTWPINSDYSMLTTTSSGDIAFALGVTPGHDPGKIVKIVGVPK